MKPRIPILYIDIEGGWGGSSRSLYYIVKYLDKNRFNPIVVCGKEGPIRSRYSEIDIPTFLFSPIPRINALAQNNFKSLVIFALKVLYIPGFLIFVRRLVKKYKIRLVHLNHESLFFIAIFLKIFFNCRIIYHVRTMLPKNIFGKIQMRIVAHTADYLIFISENEKKLWEETYPRSKKVPQSVIYNFFETPTAIDRKDVLSDYKDKFKLASLSTISGRRGTDRLIDVAEALEKKGSHNVLFVICGKGKASYIGSLKSSIKTKSLEDSFLFLGHQEFPEFILSECDALIKLPRTYNPWGRNVIEAMMCGRPVISLGTYNRFITDGVNGYLLPEFNPEDIAERIIYLYDHPEVVQKMGRVNIDKGRLLFDAATNIFKINRVYEELTAQ